MGHVIGHVTWFTIRYQAAYGTAALNAKEFCSVLWQSFVGLVTVTQRDSRAATTTENRLPLMDTADLKAGFQPDASNATHATQGTCVKFDATHASHATQATQAPKNSQRKKIELVLYLSLIHI